MMCVSGRDHTIDAEEFGHAPGLGGTTAGIVGRVAVEDLRDAAETGILRQVTQQRPDQLGRPLPALRAEVVQL